MSSIARWTMDPDALFPIYGDELQQFAQTCMAITSMCRGLTLAVANIVSPARSCFLEYGALKVLRECET